MFKNNYNQSLDELSSYLYNLDYVMGVENLRNGSFEITAISDEGKVYKVVKDSFREALLNMKLKITLVELQREAGPDTSAKMLVMAKALQHKDKIYIEGLLDSGPFLMAKMDDIFRKDLIQRSSMILHPESSNFKESQRGMALMEKMKEYFEQFDDKASTAEIDEFLKGKIKYEELSTPVLDAYTQGTEYWKEEVARLKRDNLLKTERPKLRIV
ncbi:hypothetical protein IPC755_28545 [Pseudomonas aeruginosa]|uniref:hypothetical protein n=1 Tax=Pseudomonas aeruginosa TaxID=287 RepID=UPI000FC43180|nr:hypothetical protein [Pseudomonas aeruginosa]RUG38103.1 hypothetical protein IPC755_28545 [Pseudomonas aeruginosa]